jgi:hypothetical protein
MLNTARCSNLFNRHGTSPFMLDKMTFNYTLPMPPDNSRKEVVSVLNIVPPAPTKGIIPHRNIETFFDLPVVRDSNGQMQ